MYLIKTTKGYIALDYASGGYPYITTLLTVAKIWLNKDAAVKYYMMFQGQAAKEGWCLYEFEVKTTKCLAQNGEIL